MKYLIFYQKFSLTSPLYTENLGDYNVFYVPDWVLEEDLFESSFLTGYWNRIHFDFSSKTVWTLLCSCHSEKNVRNVLREIHQDNYVVWHKYNPEWMRWNVSSTGNHPDKMSSFADVWNSRLHTETKTTTEIFDDADIEIKKNTKRRLTTPVFNASEVLDSWSTGAFDAIDIARGEHGEENDDYFESDHEETATETYMTLGVTNEHGEQTGPD